MTTDVHAARHNSARKLTYFWFLTSFLLPPGMWLLNCWYSGLFSAEEVMAVAAAPVLGIYVVCFMPVVMWLLHRHVQRINEYQLNPRKSGLADAQKSVTRIPVLLCVSQLIYNGIGPNTGMYGMSFIDSTEYSLGLVMAVCCIVASAIPCILLCLVNLERFASNVPLPSGRPAFGIGTRLAVVVIGSGMGTITLATAYFCTIIYKVPDVALGDVITKAIVVGVMSAGVLALSIWLISSQLSCQLSATLKAANAVSQGDYNCRVDIFERSEVGLLAGVFNSMTASIKQAIHDTQEAAQREQEAQAEQARQAQILAEAQRKEAMEAERKVKRILETANRVAKKDYSMELDVTGDDAIGQLADGFRNFFAEKRRTEINEAEAAEVDHRAAVELRAKVDHLLNVVEAAAGGDLTKDIRIEGDQPVDELAAGIKKMLEDLSVVIREVSDSAVQFDEGSRVIAESSQTLAEGAQTQTNNVDQMSATMEELTRSVETVRDNATEAENVAKETNRLAEEGGRAVEKSIEAMELIRTSSNEINEIIQVIAEIASQTNLLALNAAIEAARAGEHGMGFAVVADEVRKLAERSNQAAGEISGLIEESTHRVQEGAELSTATGESLRKIIEGVKTTSKRIGQITMATIEQAGNADKVSKTIQNVTSVTDHVSSGSEEMASSSEELGSQALALRNIVTRFKTDANLHGCSATEANA